MWQVATKQDSIDTKHKSEAQTQPKRGKEGLHRRLTFCRGRKWKLTKRNNNKKNMQQKRAKEIGRLVVEVADGDREIREQRICACCENCASVCCGQEGDEKPTPKHCEYI